jgi:hypothetical protein
MAKIIAVAENFAFGPISKLVTVTNILQQRGHEIIFIGYGTAYELGSKQKYSKIYKFNTDSSDFQGWATPIFKNADFIISSCDRSSIILAQKLGLPHVWLDILFFWWDEIPEYILNADLYIQQNSLNNERNLKKYGGKTKNMKIVGPIIDLSFKANQKKKQLLVAYGGMEGEGWYRVGKDSMYPYTFSKLIIDDVDTSKYDKVLFVGNERITKDLQRKYGNKKFVFSILPHDEMLKEISESEDILMVPGLETPLEAIAYKRPIFFIPPSNSSQYVQLDDFRSLNIANKSNSIHFADYFPYKKLAGKNLRLIMDEFLKELKEFENSKKILKDCAKRINNYLNRSTKEKNMQILEEKKFNKRLGINGLQKTVDLIEGFIKTV